MPLTSGFSVIKVANSVVIQINGIGNKFKSRCGEVFQLETAVLQNVAGFTNFIGAKG